MKSVGSLAGGYSNPSVERNSTASIICFHSAGIAVVGFAAAVSLYVTHYNMCRVHEAPPTTPAVALGLADRVWSIGDLLGGRAGGPGPRPRLIGDGGFGVIEGGLS